MDLVLPEAGELPSTLATAPRYRLVTKEKSGGVTYTPKSLADFVGMQIVAASGANRKGSVLRVLDPAVGDGELLLSLLDHMHASSLKNIEVHGFETNEQAMRQAAKRLSLQFPGVSLHLKHADFLEYVLSQPGMTGGLFTTGQGEKFDLVIANPPYVRTQVMGTAHAQLLSQQFGLNGRVDLYHAFLLGIAQVLKHGGTAGVIVSNRFMTTRSGASVRQALREAFDIEHVWDLGDTKIFDVAVLPAVLLVHGKQSKPGKRSRFTSIYATTQSASMRAANPILAIAREGVVELEDGRRFEVRQGELDVRGPLDNIWRIATEAGDSWLATVAANTWGSFGSIGKIRVGVKTCADKVFIRDDWESLPQDIQPELLRPLITHHIGRRFRAFVADKPRQILYPHQMENNCRIASDLAQSPRAAAYLRSHRDVLESRRYVVDSGRNWYEIWVPQDPAAWDRPKLVFRDISEKPMFWIDLDGSVVNGDCYWLVANRHADERLLWLAVAVGNSTFIEAFYDHRFNNKLYAGRRRFMTQYVEQFPIPNPDAVIGQEIIERAKALYHGIEKSTAGRLETELNQLVWKAFGLSFEETGRQGNL